MNYTQKKVVFSKSIIFILMIGLLISPFSKASAAPTNDNPYQFNIQNATAVFDSVVGCTITTNSISNTISRVLIKGEKFGAKTNSRFQEVFNSVSSGVGKASESLVNLSGKNKDDKESLAFSWTDDDGSRIEVTEDELKDLENDLKDNSSDPNSLGLKTTEELESIKKLTYGWKADVVVENSDVEKFNKFIEQTGVYSSQLVTDKETNKNTKETTKEAEETKKNTQKTAAQLEEQTVREQCLNGVAYALAKKQLSKITNDTLNWVNTGLGGEPFFVRDQLSYLNNVADEQLLKFIGPMSSSRNSSLYPYGRNFARGVFLDRSTSFEKRSVSTMSRSLPPNTTTDDWSNDFSRGGWDAWFAFTQNPYNNPLGYQLEATNELAKRQNEAIEAASKEIDQGNGFLSDKKCVEWVGRNSQSFGFVDESGSTIEITDDDLADLEEELETAERENDLSKSFSVKDEDGSTIEVTADELKDIRESLESANDLDGLYGPYSTSNGNMSTGTTDDGKTCLRWEVITPGSVISNQLNTALTSGIRQLELADSVNESLSVLFESLLTNLMGKGLKNLDQTIASSTMNTNNGSFGNFYDSLGNNLSLLPGYNNSRDILNVNKGAGVDTNEFDLTIDLGDITGDIYYEGCKTSTTAKGYVPCITLKDKDLVNPIVLDECSDGIDNDGDGSTDSNDPNCALVQKGIVKKGLITLQKDYIEAVKKSTIELPRVMPALGELDYCIPGPNPGWRESAIEDINANIEFIRSLSVDEAGNIQSIYGKMAELDKRFSENKEGENLALAGQIVGGAAPIVGTFLTPVGGLIATGIGNLFNIAANKVAADKQEKAYTNYYNATELQKRYLVEGVKEFETDRANAITKLVKTFSAYESDYENLYGPQSLMRTPSSFFKKNDFYLPMADSGLAITKNMRIYAKNISKARTDYEDLMTEANANIYKLEEIKKKVDVIVNRAKGRRALEISTGKLKIDPACYGLIDLNLEDFVKDATKNNGGVSEAKGTILNDTTTKTTGGVSGARGSTTSGTTTKTTGGTTGATGSTTSGTTTKTTGGTTGPQ